MAIQNEKAININALMKNPSLSKLMKQAMQTNPGSAKRKKASSILRSFHKKQPLIMDGQGGAVQYPGLSGVRPEEEKPFALDASGSLVPATEERPEIGMTPQGSLFVFPSASNKKAKQESLFIEEIGAWKDPSSIRAGEAAPIPDPEVSVVEPPPSGGVSIMDLPKEDVKSITIIPEEELDKPIDQEGPQIPGQNELLGYEELSEEELSGWEEILQDAALSGVGKNTFAWSIMESENKIRELEKFSGLPEGSLPRGAAWADQLPELRSRIKEEVGLDIVYDNLEKLQAKGLMLEDDLALETSRDEYIDKLAGMIDESKNKLLTTENVFVRKRLEKYLNHLYVRIGKEEQRYSEYITNAIKHHDKKVDILEDEYKKIYKEFETRLADDEKITKNEYERFKTMLEEMYENVENREKDLLQIDYWKIRNQKSLIDLNNTVLDSSVSSMTKAQETKASSAYFKANPNATIEDWENMGMADKLRWYAKSTEDILEFPFASDEEEEIKEDVTNPWE